MKTEAYSSRRRFVVGGSDRVLVLHKGRLAAEGSPEDAITPTLLAEV